MSTRRCAGALLVVLASAGWIAAGALPWVSALALERVQRGEPEPASLLRLPWIDAPARAWARRHLRRGATRASTAAQALLEHSARLRPLYAPTWLLLAEQAHRSGDRRRAAGLLHAAVTLWPGRERLLWDAIGLAAEMGERELSFELLARVLFTNRDRAEEVFAIAHRLEPTPSRLVDALVPELRRSTDAGKAALIGLLWIAASEKDGSLADAAWHRLPPSARALPETAALYVDALVASGRIEDGVAAWSRFGPRGATARGLSDPGFEREFLQRGFGWRVGAPAGASWERDSRIRREGRHSLRISFHGNQNVSFLHAAQTLVVEPGRTYRLRGWWRGEALNTRSGPYLELVSGHGSTWLQATSSPRVGTWDWEPFEFEFEVPGDVWLIELRLRRDPLIHSERGFGGRVWLDDLDLVPAGRDEP